MTTRTEYILCNIIMRQKEYHWLYICLFMLKIYKCWILNWLVFCLTYSLKKSVKPQWQEFPFQHPSERDADYLRRAILQRNATRYDLASTIHDKTQKKTLNWGQILGRIPDKVLRVFLLALQSHLNSMASRFLYLQTHATSYVFLQNHVISYVFIQTHATQPLTYFYSSFTVHCKGERRKT